MKGININGTVKTYNKVPKTWGNIIGVNYMSDEDLKTLGFYDIVVPELTTGKELGDIYFNSEDEVFTYPVNTATITETLQELKDSKVKSIKEQYRVQLAETDWIVIRDQELGQTTDQSILDERAQLRTDCATHETAVNAKTTKVSVIDYTI